MKNKNILILLLILFSAFLFISCKKEKKVVEGFAQDAIKIELKSDKRNYNVNNEIKLTFDVINNSDEVIELNVTDIVNISGFTKIGYIHENQVSYTKGKKALFLKEELGEGKTLVNIRPEESVKCYIFLKINPIKKFTDVPYDTNKIFIEIKIDENDYPQNIESFYKKVIGSYKSNEVEIIIDSKNYEKKFTQYLDTDFETKYHKLSAVSTDQFILKGLYLLPSEELSEGELKNDDGYVKTYRYKDFDMDIFFEFYRSGKIIRFGQMLFNDKGIPSDFVIYKSNGLIDIRYEIIRKDDNTILRWDKYVVDYLNGKDIYLGYIKLKIGENAVWISELLLKSGDKFKKFEYNKFGKKIKREEVQPPIKELKKDRRF